MDSQVDTVDKLTRGTCNNNKSGLSHKCAPVTLDLVIVNEALNEASVLCTRHSVVTVRILTGSQVERQCLPYVMQFNANIYIGMLLLTLDKACQKWPFFVHLPLSSSSPIDNT